MTIFIDKSPTQCEDEYDQEIQSKAGIYMTYMKEENTI